MKYKSQHEALAIGRKSRVQGHPKLHTKFKYAKLVFTSTPTPTTPKNIKFQWPINNKWKKQCSTSETRKDTKIKTTMGFPLTQV